MTTRYLKKLKEIGKARNSSNTASKVRGIKWTSGQRSNMRIIAASIEPPTIEVVKELYPNLGGYKAERMLNEVKKLRKKMSEITGLEDGISGIRNSKGDGIIYLVENEMYPGWIKCGMTVNMSNRLNSYNCYDPLKRFRIITEKSVSNRRKSEAFLKRELESVSSLSNGEWFRIEKEQALKIFNNVQ